MRFVFSTVVLVFFSASNLLLGQVTAVQLTVSDAKELLESLPSVADSKGKGRCPTLQMESLDDKEVLFVVREVCIPEPSGLLGHFIVSRYSGRIRDWTSEDYFSLGPKADALLARVRGERIKQQLTGDDAICLARQLRFYKELTQENCSPSFRLLESSDNQYFRLLVLSNCGSQEVMVPLSTITIDKNTGIAMDDQNGTILDYDNCEMRQDMLMARFLPKLTPAEAKQLLEKTNLITELKSKQRCVSIDFDPNTVGGKEFLFLVSTECEQSSSPPKIFFVDFYSGRINFANKNELIDSPQLTGPRSDFLTRARERQQLALERVRRICSR